jgi:starvation-inducible DNA-binding protein
LTIIENDAPHAPTDEMIAQLATDNEAIAKRMGELAEMADENGDLYTHDLLVSRIGVHEKNAWMLRASVAAE